MTKLSNDEALALLADLFSGEASGKSAKKSQAQKPAGPKPDPRTVHEASPHWATNPEFLPAYRLVELVTQTCLCGASVSYTRSRLIRFEYIPGTKRRAGYTTLKAVESRELHIEVISTHHWHTQESTDVCPQCISRWEAADDLPSPQLPLFFG